MSVDVTIIDYGLGNLNSVQRALSAAGGNPQITSDPHTIAKSKKLILPGVGAFEAGMTGLRERGQIEPIMNALKSGSTLLGLCLGMQLLFEGSEEFGQHEGLKLLKGSMRRFHEGSKDDLVIKIPQIGWNSLLVPKNVSWANTILEDVTPGEMVYFVHSFAAFPEDCTSGLAETQYGNDTFYSVVAEGQVMGTQFHPEKSGKVGQKILRKFLSQ